MNINQKLAPIPLALSLALTGCLGQDDNDGIVDALRDQNELLE